MIHKRPGEEIAGELLKLERRLRSIGSGKAAKLMQRTAEYILKIEAMVVTEPEDLDTEAAEAREETGSGGHVPLRVAEGDDHPTGAPV